MFEFLMRCGVFVWPLLLLTVTLVLQALRAIRRLSRRQLGAPAAGQIDTLLFWGGVAAVLGVLGQSTGIYNALQVIGSVSAVSPAVIAQGFAESFTTTLFGLTLLLTAGLAWLALRAWHARLLAAEARP